MAQINKPSEHFNTITYTGDGASSKSLTGVGFQPDFVWIKSRSNTDDNTLFDAVRGTQKYIETNNTDAEATITNGLSSFDSDGFTVGTHTPINRSSGTHVAWNWKANGSGSANTDGTVNTTVSTNTTSGFSIVTYTGNGQSGNNTFGHGLGVAPKVIWWFPRSGTTNKHFWTDALPLSGGEYQAMQMNLTAAPSAFGSSSVMNAQAPTSTVFTLENADYNTNNVTYVAYCFAEKKGYSKFGSYTGNGNANGTFIYTGFKPAWVMYKNTSTTTDSWLIHDNKRGNQGAGANPQDLRLLVNGNQTDADVNIDFLSNGFKMRDNGAHMNASGNVYIYMAFAEAPIVGTNNIPATAR